MKKVFCGFVVLLALAVVSAQTPSSGGDQGQTSTDQTAKTAKSGKKKGNTLTGCLSGEQGAYMLKSKRGKEVAVTGSDDLSKHVGHEVKLHGSWEKSAEGSEKTEASAGKKSGRTFNVTSIDHISDTCPAAGTAAAGGHHHHHKAAEGAAPAEGGANPTPSPSPSPQP
jgi:hypothetical protein